MKITSLKLRQVSGNMPTDGEFWEERLVRPIDIYPEHKAERAGAGIRDDGETTVYPHSAVFIELARVLRPGGFVAFEVGEIRAGTLRLEEHVIPCSIDAGLEPRLVLINAQQFTKTAACWGVDNNAKGTNSNRIVLLQKP